MFSRSVSLLFFPISCRIEFALNERREALNVRIEALSERREALSEQIEALNEQRVRDTQ